MDVVNRVLYFFFSGLGAEAKKVIKINGLIIALKALKNGHKIIVLFFELYMSVMFVTASFFSLLIYNFNNGIIYYDFFNFLTLGIGFSSAIFLWWNLREKRWLDLLGVQDELDKLISKQTPPPSTGRPKNDFIFNEDDLQQMIEQIFERKIKQYEKQNKDNSPASLLH